MWNRIRAKIGGKNNKVLLNELLFSVRKLAKTNNTLVLYGSPTQGNWLGIANATKSLYPADALEIPQYYSNPVLKPKEAQILWKEIRALKFERIIISGFASYFFEWIDELYLHCSIEVIFHGTISEFHDKSRRDFVKKLIVYGKAKKISKFGFVKIGMSEVFQNLYHFDCYHQALPKPIIPSNLEKLKLDRSKIHIGVFGADTFNKNLHNQVIHALMIENVLVHVLDKSIFDYLDLQDRIVEHGSNLKRETFLGILGSMDANLYMSYNESWGLVAYESEAMGVPALKVMDIDYLLKIKLLIDENKLTSK